MASTPTNKAELLKRIDVSYHQLEDTIAALSDAQLTTPIDGGWSVKDMVAHIAAWEQVTIHFHVGKQPFEAVTHIANLPYASTGVDQINEAFFQRDRALDWTQVKDAFHSSHQEMLNLIESLSEADLHTKYTPVGRNPDDGHSLIAWICGDTYEHYDEHRETIQRLFNA